ncbi:unnamed protein product [Lepeophtheirus salmonis]|uniref:(salmon louse) hypothetical protein n=1 Tax=Lepeophtheirus salmonis TaxID=72036 RepID=A0A7R8CM66_LEPSM|nr:unnamed protein product [Lepeophtheirus salmonis]CAF2864144.1 unnamed protein product [Lepeophtheirus salmonis]
MNLMSSEFMERVEYRNGSWFFSKKPSKEASKLVCIEGIRTSCEKSSEEEIGLADISDPYDKGIDTLTTGGVRTSFVTFCQRVSGHKDRLTWALSNSIKTAQGVYTVEKDHQVTIETKHMLDNNDYLELLKTTTKSIFGAHDLFDSVRALKAHANVQHIEEYNTCKILMSSLVGSAISDSLVPKLANAEALITQSMGSQQGTC